MIRGSNALPIHLRIKPIFTKNQDMKHFLLLCGAPLLLCYSSFGQCANEANIITFSSTTSEYEIVKETKTWVDASACAVERGGILVHIDSVAENELIFDNILDADIVSSSTIAPDGGGGAYLWIGATDRVDEGRWIWDGDNEEGGELFWLGDETGTSIDDLYNNWPSAEPDDFGSGQDAAGISIDGWPLGVASEWNDVAEDNQLYYIIEKPIEGATIPDDDKAVLDIFYNSTLETVQIKTSENLKKIAVYDMNGKLWLESMSTTSLSIDDLPAGTYIISLTSESGLNYRQKIIKQ